MQTDTQLAFFRALCAPFDKSYLFTKSSGGTTLTYLKAPTIMNRLDDVAGPSNWSIEYIETDRGYICRLGISVPTGDDPNTRVWLYKDDVGGYEGMTKKAGGEMVADTDNDEKSAATNGLRRAAHVWGIGRDLWKCGSAEYLGDRPPVPDLPPPARRDPEPADDRRNPDREPERAPAGNGPARRAPAGSRAPAGGGGGGDGDKKYDNFRIPKGGRALFAWASNLAKHYGLEDKAVVKVLDTYAKEQGYQGKYADYDQDQIDDVAWFAIETIQSWQCYKGEFDHISMPESLGDPR